MRLVDTDHGIEDSTSVLLAALSLSGLPGIGDARANKLTCHFGGPLEALSAASQWVDHAASIGIERHVLERAAAASGTPAHQRMLSHARQILVRCRAFGLVLGQSGFPDRLAELDLPPLLLTCIGKSALLSMQPSVAIVGSRNATPQGLAMAYQMAGRLASAGVVVISGLALGIDAAAHSGALAARGATVAVLGGGIDRVYPRENAALYAKIRHEGLLVSQFMPGTAPMRHHFVVRNRVIAALADVVVVVEAGVKSGAVGTAMLAADLGKEIFAVPGDITRPTARGCNALIKSGVLVCEGAADIFTALQRLGYSVFDRRDPDQQHHLGSNDLLNKVFVHLDATVPLHPNELVRLTRLSAAQVAVALSELLLNGLIHEVAHDRFVKAEGLQSQGHLL